MVGWAKPGWRVWREESLQGREIRLVGGRTLLQTPAAASIFAKHPWET